MENTIDFNNLTDGEIKMLDEIKSSYDYFVVEQGGEMFLYFKRLCDRLQIQTNEAHALAYSLREKGIIGFGDRFSGVTICEETLDYLEMIKIENKTVEVEEKPVHNNQYWFNDVAERYEYHILMSKEKLNFIFNKNCDENWITELTTWVVQNYSDKKEMAEYFLAAIY